MDIFLQFLPAIVLCIVFLVGLFTIARFARFIWRAFIAWCNTPDVPQPHLSTQEYRTSVLWYLRNHL